MLNFQRKQTSLASKTFLMVGLWAGLAGLFQACSERRDPLQLSNPSTVDSSDYGFPHPADWSVKHVGFYARNGRQIEGTVKSCNSCHDHLNVSGPALKVTCALACHSQASPQPIPGDPGSAPHVRPTPIANECSTCHADHLDRPTSHYPAAAGLCIACHDVKREHIAGTAPHAVTTLPAPASCLNCHDRMDRNANVHPALAMEGSCTNCHDPHGSNQMASLKQNVENTCMGCHDAVPAHSKSIHGIIKTSERSCVNCHNPHSSDRKKLLLADSNTLCLSCHNKEIQTTFSADSRVLPNIEQKITTAKFIHKGAKGEDSCIGCHNPHASTEDRLAILSYPSKHYSRYEPGNDKVPNTYALCFQCHDTGILDGNEPLNTSFRNDKEVGGTVTRKNMHWFHVVDAAGGTNKNNGRSCFNCHDTHGAEQPHGIKASSPMGNYPVTIQYQVNPDGGQCTKTCHNLKVYKRIEE